MLRLAYCALVLSLTAGAVVLTYRHLAARQVAASTWLDADVDGDGRPLRRDLDPDADGLDLLADPDADGDAVENAQDIVAGALSMVGRPTDPLMGMYNNLLGRIGFVVCVDVVVESWMMAGLSLPELLTSSAWEHPEWFAIDPLNGPADPNFPRRVRNYRDLFEMEPGPGLALDSAPHPGDVAFYGRYHAAIVTAVRPEGYTVVEAYSARVAERDGGEVAARTGVEPVFGRVGR